MMKVTYKCVCMTAEAEIEVTSRPADADVVLWVEAAVAGAIAVDHSARSPRCMATAMEYVKIPVDEDAPGIGVKPPLAS